MSRYLRISIAALAFAILVPIAASAGIGAPARERVGQDPTGSVKPDGIIAVPDRDNGVPLDIEVWVRGEDRIFRPGDNVNVYFRVSRDAYVLLYDVDTEGRVHQIYPRTRWDDEFAEAGVTYAIPGRGAGYRLMVTGPAGREDIVGVASDRPLADRWDTSWDGISSRNDYDELGGTRLRMGRFGENRLGEMDRLAQRLVEVPVDRPDHRFETASDRVTLQIGRSRERGRWGDDRYHGRRGRGRW